MDVYDWDKTLYHGDSTAHFTLWCLRRHPGCLATLPRTAIAALAFATGRLEKTAFKQTLYRYLAKVPDIAGEVSRFWEAHESGIGGPCSPAPGDLVISASPDFLLRDVCERRGLALIASRVDPSSGKYEGLNCSGEEKVSRFRELYPDASVHRFFSDSLGDSPMARLADEAWLVDIRRGACTPWPAR